MRLGMRGFLGNVCIHGFYFAARASVVDEVVRRRGLWESETYHRFRLSVGTWDPDKRRARVGGRALCGATLRER